jgi:hypothetical protein
VTQDEVNFTGADLNASAAAGKEVRITKNRFTLALAPALIRELQLADSGYIIAGLNNNTAAVGAELQSKLKAIDALNETLLKERYTASIQLNSSKVSSFTSPIKISVDLSGWTLTDSQKAKLTGVIYDSGFKAYRQLCGEVSADSRSFEFYAYSTGELGIIVSDNLTKIRFAIDSRDYYKNNINVSNDVAPYISDNRAMLPIRAVAEALGLEVGWNDASKTVTLSRAGQTLSMVIGQPLPNGLGTALINNSRTFVPIRYIAEQLGANVVWNEASRVIDIYQ